MRQFCPPSGERKTPYAAPTKTCLQVAKGKTEQAVELLSLVLHHPISNQLMLGEGPIRDSAGALLTKLEDELPSETYNAAHNCGQQLEMDDVIISLFSQIS